MPTHYNNERGTLTDMDIRRNSEAGLQVPPEDMNIWAKMLDLIRAKTIQEQMQAAQPNSQMINEQEFRKFQEGFNRR